MAETITKQPIKAKTSGGGLGAMVVAIGAGYLAGILLAPRSGRDTRKMIGQKAHAAHKVAQERIEEAKTRMRDMVEDAKDRADRIKAQGQQLTRSVLDS